MTATKFDFERLATDLRAIRRTRRIDTIKQIAKESNVGESQLSNLLNHGKGLSVTNLLRLCRWLDRPIEAYSILDEPSWVARRRAADALSSDDRATLRHRQDKAVARYLAADDSEDASAREIALDAWREVFAQLIDQHRDEMRRIAREHQAYDIRLFGSFARGSSMPGSDIDVVVRFEPGVSLMAPLGLQVALRDLLEVGVDVLDENGLRDELRVDVLREAVPV